MKLLIIGLIVLGVFIFVRRLQAQEAPNPGRAYSIYDFTVKTIDGKDQSLADYRGQVLLIVNTASQKAQFLRHRKVVSIFPVSWSSNTSVIAGAAKQSLKNSP